MRTLVTNAKIHSMDKFNSVYNSMIIEKDRIVLLGDYKELKSSIKDGDIVWDMEGRTVIPGMIDSHIHFLDYSLSLNEISLRGVRSIEECAVLVRDKATNTQPDQWITGGGWDKSLWGGEFPTKEVLDEISPYNPVYLISKDCHTSWVNSLALELASIDIDTSIDGGEIEKSNGMPTGILKENAQSIVRSAIPYPDDEIIEKALLQGIQKAHSLGFTAVHSMSLQNDASFYTLYKSLKRIKDKGLLTLRFTLNPILTVLEELIDSGMEKEFNDDLIRLGATKLFTDGSLGSQSAWMIDDYADRPGWKGIPIEHGKKLEESIRRSIILGYPVTVHAIGDRANKEVLDVLEKQNNSSTGLRHRIEHAQILDPDDIKRFAQLGIVASVQPIHLLEDIDMINRYWGERGRWAYPFNSLLKSGAALTFGSDSPVEDLNPFAGIYAAVSRKRVKDTAPFYEGERIPAYEALKAYTWGPAYATGDERLRGTLEIGKKADFAVLNNDIFNIAPTDILNIKVEASVVDGKMVYNRAR